ncbi:heterokaryon incompatibility protein-domain-containing protein [Ilyonectria destructans]|nr:heterokaryon incompatibility protein-domain-containing protein [Ilyonectria destructans]
MTSISRDDSNVYKFGELRVKEPLYSTLSYTWGRWRIGDGSAQGAPALPIKNTPWRIPAVKQEHFTVRAFQNVVHKIQMEGTNWVWIDVGCIDQNGGVENSQAAIEIGQQASIFKQARNTFVWLSRIQSGQLQSALDNILDYSLILDEYVHRPSINIDFDSAIDKLQNAFSRVFSDPWFSSLWTLQEVVLRHDALVLSTEGEPVLWEKEPTARRMYLTMFINHCRNVYNNLAKVERQVTLVPLLAQTAYGIKQTMQKIVQAGFYYLFSTNPNVQYGTARYRTTSRKEDRIYAIMQIYGICVGKSARPNENPSLEELVTEFAGAINQRSPILGQLFVHTARPRYGTTWQITGESKVPISLILYRHPNILANIQLIDGDYVATGSYCQFLTLCHAISADGGMVFGSSDEEGWGPDANLHLDHDISKVSSFRISEMYCLRRYTGNARKYSSTQFDSEKVRVLLLGDVGRGWTAKSETWNRMHVGLLIYIPGRGTEEDLEGAECERLGVVTWKTVYGKPSNSVTEIEWQPVRRLLLR